MSNQVLKDVEAERDRQDKAWGEQNHSPLAWLAILAEEFGEVAKEVNEIHFRQADTAAYRQELIQTAAVAVAMVECLDRHQEEEEESEPQFYCHGCGCGTDRPPTCESCFEAGGACGAW